MGEARSEVVHVHGGSSLLERLRGAGIPGRRLEWCDPVASGPTPAGISADRWYRTRAEYLASSPTEVPRIERQLRKQDEALLSVSADAELVIWSGPELFCQAILMRLLVLLGNRGDRGPTLSVVDPGDQPTSPGCGLTSLDTAALTAAYAARRPVSPEALALARRAWQAFTSPSARALVDLLAEDTSALPHLGPALRRHLADLPDGATGLSTSENNLLQALETGPLSLTALHAALAGRESRPFLTDGQLEEIVRRLGVASAALVTVDDAGLVHLTPRGAAVLAGHDFWSAERWHGGIHIRPDDDDDGDETEALPAPSNPYPS